MINDKYKKNKFRKLVPTSSSDTDKLQKLTTIEYQNDQTSSHLTISQQIQKSISKIGVEGVSERYKDKHFVFERRLKTISSMNQRRQQSLKQSTSSAIQNKVQQETKNSKYKHLLAMIDQFKQKSMEISNSKTLEQLNSVQTHTKIQTEEQVQQKFDDLIQKSKRSSLKLIFIYLQRHLTNKVRLAFSLICKTPQQLTFQTKDIIEQKRPINNCRNNLLNVSKFFGSI